ncbi:DUF58 domain-containing protein [Nocardioides islandensis]|jgi:uncharacterized protein (DUF58 family)|uniref:DUF58 domain-containing protein n=1 Tax=Nocardioides islandensis TaxID=433663 RepID=A0A930YDL5_9ACTN|nr:DUF58 domain-containing protein [Nocardioides islandensis]MBF4762867.1 DUF58 domain-containing protein [Nocardioides islandensis]
MNRWEITPALSRALLVSGLLVGGAVLLGQPALVVLAAPFVVLAAFALISRPTSAPVVRGVLDHVSLYEGQGTRSRLQVTEADGVEHVTRISAQAPYIALHPASGRVSGLLSAGVPALEVSPRRWGRRTLGEEKVALTSPWAGYRWGPVLEHGIEMTVLPASAPFDSAAEAPQPLGLVGSNRSRRVGDGTEFAGIRPFQSGDRLRRINWRVSLRTGDLHVVTSRGEEDSGVLLVVDALSDFGRSGGVGAGASSLDVTMRAASALAEHFTRNGDRVALRVIGGAWETVGYGAGQRHLRQILGRLAGVRPARLRDDATERLRFGATAGTVVIVLSPLLADAVVTAAASLHRRGLPLIAVDTLPDEAAALAPEDTDGQVADLAWRLRRTEREHLLTALARQGCPVVQWRGPGTLDDVLHRLARRAQLPQVRVR